MNIFFVRQVAWTIQLCFDSMSNLVLKACLVCCHICWGIFLKVPLPIKIFFLFIASIETKLNWTFNFCSQKLHSRGQILHFSIIDFRLLLVFFHSCLTGWYFNAINLNNIYRPNYLSTYLEWGKNRGKRRKREGGKKWRNRGEGKRKRGGKREKIWKSHFRGLKILGGRGGDKIMYDRLVLLAHTVKYVSKQVYNPKVVHRTTWWAGIKCQDVRCLGDCWPILNI